MEIEKVRKTVENAIHNEEVNLVDNLENLETQREHENFLAEIAGDYKKYQAIIIHQKEMQKEQLYKIFDYLNEIIEVNASTTQSLTHTYNEQKRLVNEIKKIQVELDNINLD